MREETERAATAIDGVRSYYLAVSGVERASMEMLWTALNPGNPVVPQNSSLINYHFATGEVQVEVIPEAAKLNINTVSPELLARLCLALGMDPVRAQQVTAGIVAWRQGGNGLGGASLAPTFGQTFQASQASFHEIEELLLVNGVTPDIFYGTYVPAPESWGDSGPRLVPRPGLADCLSVYGGNGHEIDANAAAPAVLLAVGLAPQVVSALVQRRQRQPFTDQELVNFASSVGASGVQLRAMGHSIVTYRATARLRLPDGRLSDLRRTVAAQVKYMPPGYDSQIHVLRWYDSAWSAR